MELTLDQVAEAALRLPSSSRAILVERLVESLGFSADDDAHRLWAEEAVRRRDEVRSGEVQPIPGDQVTAEMRRLVGR